MKLLSQLCFYYETTVVLIDDNIEFLDSIECGLIKDFNLISYSDPFQAIKNFESSDNFHDNDIVNEIDTVGTLDEDVEYAISIDIAKISNKINIHARHDEISVVVIDYAMPGINGVEFCRNINTKYVKKILLTGAGEEKIAIDAFNDGVIDRYISKHSINYLSDVKESILFLQKQYFSDRCNFINSAISFFRNTFYNTRSFINEFNDFLRDKQIIEFYMLDSNGSFIGIDENKCPHWFIVRNTQQMLWYNSVAEGGGASQSIIDKLKNNKHMIYILPNKCADTLPSDWDNSVYPVCKIFGNYFLSLVDGQIPGFSATYK